MCRTRNNDDLVLQAVQIMIVNDEGGHLVLEHTVSMASCVVVVIFLLYVNES